MTLHEFLLARIADDEAHIRERDNEFLEWCQECGFWKPPSPYSMARLLAECAAKRAIVEGMEPFGPIDDIAAPEILGILAVPYADHPDYREEWRP